MRWRIILALVMIGCMRLVPIKMATGLLRRTSQTLMVCLLALLMTGCGILFPLPGQLPVEIPGMPSDWGELQGLMGELGIPDLSSFTNVPGLEALGGLQTPPGAIAYQGPLELGINAGQTIPGTDIRLVNAEAGADVAQFEIAGLRAPRRMGDSLDFDGAWPGISGVSYQLRLRVYQIGDGSVHAAGVQRLVIVNISPQVANEDLNDNEINGRGVTFAFPHTVTSKSGELFPGMTFGYSGQDERGATLRGLSEGEYPYRKLGDSVEWAGVLTPKIAVVYHLRLLYYQETSATLGGVAIVNLPGP